MRIPGLNEKALTQQVLASPGELGRGQAKDPEREGAGLPCSEDPAPNLRPQPQGPGQPGGTGRRGGPSALGRAPRELPVGFLSNPRGPSPL